MRIVFLCVFTFFRLSSCSYFYPFVTLFYVFHVTEIFE
jgi:hypothetical protein